MCYRFILVTLLLMGICWSSSGGVLNSENPPQPKKHVLRWLNPNKAGINGKKLALVDTIMCKAVRDSAFPGAVLLVAKDGMIVHHKAYGHLEYGANVEKVDTNTIFDIASLTKVIATTNACMRLIDERKLRLKDRVVKYLPDFGKNGKSKITIQNLLLHNSGLPAWKPFYRNCHDPKCLLDSIFALPLVAATGDSTIYSDFGFIVLGKIIEKVCATTLDRYVDSVFFRPLGMWTTMYNPPANLISRIAPTEIDTLREKSGKAIRGQVHDENAAILGGVSGHAGLFSTASDLAIILEMIRNGGEYGGKRFIRKATVEQFIHRQSQKSTRALGWDTKKPQRSWAGELLSNKAFIHAGFTGTSVVVDPHCGVIIVLLTNRVFPTRENEKIAEVRPKVHDGILGALK